MDFDHLVGNPIHVCVLEFVPLLLLLQKLLVLVHLSALDLVKLLLHAAHCLLLRSLRNFPFKFLALQSLL